MLRNSSKKGFTLIEILLVVAAISILASIVIVAINPAKQLGETRNAQRRSDVRTILDAVWQYAIDNSGTLPTTLLTGTCDNAPTTQEICKLGGTCTGLTDLSVLTANEKYIVAIPFDPSTGTGTDRSGYYITKTAFDRVSVCAPAAFAEVAASVGASGIGITITR